MQRIALGTIAFVAAAGTGISGVRAQHAPDTQSAAVQGKKAEEQFKNIQVLKGIPADQLVPGMQFIAASLGVECQFCHVQDAFDKDDKKPKQIARKMMTMMFAINKDNFDSHRVVTCNSCHRGNIKPLAIPAVMEENQPTIGAAAKAVDNLNAAPDGKEAAPTAEQLFDNYLKTVGGAAAVDKITSRTMKGTITFGDRNIPIDIYSKDPDKRISFTHTPDGDSVTAFDGHEGWLGFPGRPPREMHGQELDAAAIDADLHFAVHLKEMFSDAQVQGTEKIDDRDAYVVVGKRNSDGKPPLRLYFDEHTGLLLRMVRYADTPFGLLPTQIDYADYRDASGEKIPFRWTLARTSGRFTIQLSEVKQNAPVDDAKFAKPSAPPVEPSGPAK